MDVKDLVGLSDPAKTFIERCSDALGAWARPWQIKRIAEAEAEAAVIEAQAAVEVAKIKALGGIEVSEVEERAMRRLVHEEGKKQQNIEAVVAKALPQVEATAKPENIEEDWLLNFFDKCRLVSDADMQLLWAKILAGEANEPGSYSRRTLNFLQSLDKSDAVNFHLLCRFSIVFDRIVPIIYDVGHEVYNNTGLIFHDIQNLQSLGLLSYENLFGYSIEMSEDTFVTSYFSDNFSIKLKKDSPLKFQIGRVALRGRLETILCT